MLSSHSSSVQKRENRFDLNQYNVSPVAHVAGAVFVGGTSCAATDPIHVLIALGGVLSKVDAGAKHATDVGVALVEALMDDGVDEGRS